MSSTILTGGLPGCPQLHPGEDLDDWLAVTASLYSSDPDAVLDLVARLLDWSRSPSGHVERVDELKMELESQLRAHGGARAGLAPVPALLAPASYCPLCIEADLRRGVLPYFRREWQHSLRTMCSLHRTPLFGWALGWAGNPRGLPSWIIENYRRSRPLSRRATLEREVDRYRAQLSRSRMTRQWQYTGVEQSAVMEQQVIWESALTDPGRYSIIQCMAGTDRMAFRRAFDDLCVVYLAHYGADWRESHPISNYSYLGPKWLFALPKRRPAAEIDLKATLPRLE